MRDRKAQLRALLLESKVFRDLDPLLVEELVGAAEFLAPRKGNAVRKIETHSDELLVVLEGELIVMRSVDEKRVMVMRRLHPNQFVGWSVLAGEAHSADLIAGDKLVMARLRGMEVRSVFRKDPRIPLRIIAAMGELVSRLSDEIQDLRFESLYGRVAKRICSLRPHGERIAIRQDQLAEDVGARRENVSRALQRLKDAGRIHNGRGWVRCRCADRPDNPGQSAKSDGQRR